MIPLVHDPFEFDPEERDYCKSLLEDAGLTEDEAEMMIEDFEMGY